jgi:hypothetical protein
MKKRTTKPVEPKRALSERDLANITGGADFDGLNAKADIVVSKSQS